MLEIENLVCKHTQYVVSENIPFTTKTISILLISAFFFFCYCFFFVFAFFGKNTTFTQSNSMRGLSEIF